MKRKSFVLVIALLSLGLTAAPALAAGTVTYLGKTTWTAKTTDSTSSGFIGMTYAMTGALVKIGDEFYECHCYSNPSGDGPYVLSGSGFKSGTTLYITLSVSQNHAASGSTNRDAGVMHFEIDTDTQNGTFYFIGTRFDSGAARTFNQRYSAGTLTLTGNPIPLGSDNVGANSLLLQLQ